MSDTAAVPIEPWKPAADGNPVPFSYVIWIKGGLPKGFNTFNEAEGEARRFAAEHPGLTVGVYQLVGWAHSAPQPPTFHEVGEDLRALIGSSAVEEAEVVDEK